MKWTLIFLVILLSCSSNKDNNLLYPDCKSSDIEMMDTCLLGKRLKEAIVLLKVDTSKFYAFHEPPGILRGVEIVTDTSIITLYTGRRSILDTIGLIDYRLYHTLILDSAILGVSWEKLGSNKKKTTGRVIWYSER